MNLDVYCLSDKGGRPVNEDTAAAKTEEGHGLFLVADGLGGHALGEVASGLTAEILFDDWAPSLPDDVQSRAQWMSEKLLKANRAILDQQRERGSDMKSTAVVLAIDGDEAAWTHIGDSRLYYISAPSGTYEITHFTEDHSVAYKRYLAGLITRWEISSDEGQSSLLRSLGNEERFEPEPGPEHVPITPGDAFLLCSDGIWEYIHDTEILVDFLKSEDAQDWAEYLLLRVMDRIDGSNDNLSLVTVITG